MQRFKSPGSAQFTTLQALVTGLPSGSHPREDELDFCSFAGFAIEIEPATQTIHDNAVYDMQAEAGAALIAPCCKERIERLAPDIRSHRAAIVAKGSFHVVLPERLHLDVKGAPFSLGKRVRDRVEEKVK